MAVFALAVTTVNARRAVVFERRAVPVTGTIASVKPDPESFQQHVTVAISVEGQRVVGRPPVLDPADFAVGQEVAVLYDPQDPTTMRLADERYHAATPVLFWAAVLVGGLLPGVMGWWWVRRVRRLAGAPGTAFAMRATVVETSRPGRQNRRWWVTLHPFDAASDAPASSAVGAYPLMAGVALSPSTLQVVEVKGDIRGGGVVVARIEERIAWPAGRLQR